MTLFITGSPCKLGEEHFTEENGFLSALTSRLPDNPAVLLVSAAPDDACYNSSVFDSTKACILKSGITPACIRMLERSNASRAGELVSEADFIILCGGHVPTQNRFFGQIGLKTLLKSFDGVILGCSAGSMNCAGAVYSHPELPGESWDPQYRRELQGLSLTDINIIPHYEQVHNVVLDGKRLFEDIVFPDSRLRPFITFPDGAYILSENGRQTLFGEAWRIWGGEMHKISENNKTYSFMNAIFISPHFPAIYSHFCARLKENGINVLGIADAPYEELNEELRNSLTEYYKVDNLEDYSQVFRAVAFFSFKYGKIDWLESNNEYWLEQDARLRTDFNITSGIGTDRIRAIKEKSEMKKYYALGKVPTARQIKAEKGFAAVKKFAASTRYPIIAKPDNGVGASGTFKIENEEDLKAFFEAHKSNSGAFVVEEFITGELCSYDAIYNSKGEPLFESMGVYPVPIMEIVHRGLESYYYIDKTVPPALAEAGRRTVKAFGIKSRFVHLEFFKLDKDREGLGKKGDYVGLEVNMRPAGGFTPDMMDYAHSTDVFKIWADMVAFDECRTPQGEQFYCAYVGRRDGRAYAHSHEDVLGAYNGRICFCGRMPDALSDALGNQVYMARLSSLQEVNGFFDYLRA